MRVGELARRTGTTVRALRYYERAGLVVPDRLPNGYREYAEVAVRKVTEIRALTGLGLSVEATRPFVECLDEGHGFGDDCPAALSAYRRAIDQLADRIDELTARRDLLVSQLSAAASRAMPSSRRVQPGPHNLTRMPPDPAAPRDSDAGARLTGVPLPALRLTSTDGGPVELARLGEGRTVVYVYPLTGQPGVDLPAGWDAIPGARGCTAEACGFRDHHQELSRAGAARVFGLSSQGADYQRELVQRLRLPFGMMSDPGFHLHAALGLPTFEAGGTRLYRRLTMIVSAGLIEHVFFPVPTPDRHAAEVLDWLRAHPAEHGGASTGAVSP